MFPISTRNSSSAVAHLLTTTQPGYILVGPEKHWQDLVASAFKILEENKISRPHVVQIPTFQDLYTNPGVDLEPLPPFKEDPQSLAFIMHSSGDSPFDASPRHLR